MKIFQKSLKRVVISVVAIALTATTIISPHAWAERVSFAVSPMNQKIVLNPGESYTGAFTITDPGTSKTDIEYNITLEPFYVDENYSTIHEEYGNTGEILDWITIKSPTQGTLTPNNSDKIVFTIDVPNDAPAGGQYASFTVKAEQPSEDITDDNSENKNSEGANTMINEEMSIAHLLFVDITGNSVRQGEIIDANVPSFLLSGNITGSSSIKNTGTTHGTSKYTLQVFPLFSDEEVYTNAEDPDTHTILPDRTLYNETTWDNTPAIGIFNVVYTVEFEGVTQQVSKMVIKCPIWLLFIIIFIIVAIVVWLVFRAKTRGKKSRKNAE
ncbi:hypothetical protein IJG04_03430 [Candidatus Saccharibacteria bacterium]|nr:hypothetical protein [Candidatus Saccharibacteria bacterium]